MLISVIVPVYNTEKYVGRCIDSIVSQTYSMFELILVDDGSTDQSPQIIDEYKEKDSRIKVIHQKNAGPGIARNAGIKMSCGDYIVFVDSDDVIKPDYLEKLSRETADVVFIDVDQVDEDLNVLHEEHMSEYKTLSKDKFLRSQMTGKILWGGVRKAAKKDLIFENDIAFSEHQVGEEALFSFLLLFYARSISFINGSVYMYVNRLGSQSDSIDDDPWGNVVKVLKNKVIEINAYEDYSNTINAFLLSSTVVSLDRMARRYRFSEYRVKAKARIAEYKNSLDENFDIDFKSLSKKITVIYPLIKMELLSLFFVVSKIYQFIKRCCT